MDRRVFVLLCLLTAVRSQGTPPAEITVNAQDMVLTCKNGKFGDKESIKMNYGNSGLHQCIPNEIDVECTDDSCPKALIKILSSENLIQLDSMALVSVIVGDILVTALIGWAIYIVCAQPTARGGYQGNKASDRQALINNHAPSGGDTYQVHLSEHSHQRLTHFTFCDTI
uniref:CD3 gamma/delta subunit Ig-like domain-containing protein n=1 Tax=Cyprinus carpio TaxID=7962 RepID=A0A8C2BD94_CYPCA